MSDKNTSKQDTSDSEDEDGEAGEGKSADGQENDHEKGDKKDSDRDASGDKNEDKDDGGDDDEDGGEDEDDVIKVARTPTSPALLSRLQHSREYNQARGLGAGGTGAATFYVQRITALALIPLAIWFAVSVVRMSHETQAAAAAWLAWPVNAAVMALFIVIALRHAVIGVQIVLEDYVHAEGMRGACVLVVKGVALVLGVAAVAALIHLAM